MQFGVATECGDHQGSSDTQQSWTGVRDGDIKRVDWWTSLE